MVSIRTATPELFVHAAFALSLLPACASVPLELGSTAAAQPDASADSQDANWPTVAQHTASMDRHEGFIPYYVDAESGQLYFELGELPVRMIYVESLARGIGSNDLGLDRGQLGDNRLVRFERRGSKVLLVEENTKFRAPGPSQASVQESFAESVIWGFDIVAREGEILLVDATSFLTRDAHGISDDLAARPDRPERGGGQFQLDSQRSAVASEDCLNFRDNTELEAITTLTGTSQGQVARELRHVVPTPQVISVRQHHSFVRLPDHDYQPRPYDPRSGYWSASHLDFSQPFDASLTVRLQPRHRLHARLDESGRVADPIVYYVDHTAPPEIRDALVTGANWWARAFAEAGFPGGFRVEILPESVHPLDIRYNVIQWTHRATRGWSYGASVTDPRTGEIIKGHVTLGSQRIRQDFLIAEALTGPYGHARQDELQQAARELALARIRQLSAHEVGHTLGLAHNFAASSTPYTSVMDYPVFVVRDHGEQGLDLSQPYETSLGRWDMLAIKAGYSHFNSDQDRQTSLDAWFAAATADGARYASDRHVHPGSSHPYAHRWDAGADPITELERVMQLRGRILGEMATGRVAPDEPTSKILARLGPVYFLHRYQVEAAVKSIAGVHFEYALARTPSSEMRIVDAKMQKRALDALLATLDADFLRLPPELLSRLNPPPPGYGSSREYPRARTAEHFDALAVAESSARHTLALLLHPARAARLVEHQARGHAAAGLSDVLARLVQSTWGQQSTRDPMAAELQRAIQGLVVSELLALSSNPTASEGVRATAYAALDDISRRSRAKSPDGRTNAHRSFVRERIADHLRGPKALPAPTILDAPPGAPIGQFACPAPEIGLKSAHRPSH